MSTSRNLELTWSEHRGHICLHVRGWTDAELRELHSAGAAGLRHLTAILPTEFVNAVTKFDALQPLAGQFDVAGDTLRFIPRFPFLDGMSYSLLVYQANGEKRGPSFEEWRIRRPALNTAPTTRVAAIYPTAEELPLNLLKFYVHFSSPMSTGKALRSVQVHREDNGKALEDVFVVMDELWDPERRRLTLLLDPGRIKRGLAPHEEAGYPLIEGVRVVLHVDATFLDASGRPLQAQAERRYAIGAPLRVRVDPKAWRVHSPAAKSKEPLTVEFDRPLDHALLQHCLWVRDMSGAPLPGQGSIGPRERFWRFEPESPWSEGQYAITADPHLEDLAGNSLVRVFDRDLERAEDTPADARPVEISVTCSA